MNDLQASRRWLVDWLCQAAYPLWSRYGIDPSSGSFVEALDQNAAALVCARRARIHPRQVYAFAQARRLGWQGEVSGIIERGMTYFLTHYRRPDGLFLTLAAADGSVQDGRALLYDQAFVLLGYAAAAAALGARDRWEASALELRLLIDRHLLTDAGAYRAEAGAEGYESNPHMHLLEAYLAWADISEEPGWRQGVQRLVDLALRRFIRSDDGAIGEFYSATWQPMPGASGNSIEPGHQFEWAWLFVRCEPYLVSAQREAAFRLIHIGETYGVHRGVAINALLDDFSVSDDHARFWPQTERLKAALTAARLTGETRYWSMAVSAAASFFPYIETETAGQWYDVQRPTGHVIAAVAPASSFYHLVGALVVLNEAAQRVA